jgi:diguanylate cyclase (GGDEF)-like protein
MTMNKESKRGLGFSEEIQGAPPVAARAEQREQRLAEKLEINRYLYSQIQQLEVMLLAATDLPALLHVLLTSMPRHLSFQVAELWLFDPETRLANLIVGADRYHPHLQLRDEVFSMQELYDIEPDIVTIDATDSRMFEVLKTDQGIDHAILMPLMDAGRLVGSLHCGLNDVSLYEQSEAVDLLAHLATIISLCFNNAAGREQLIQLSMLDPLTQMSNPRGLDRDIARETARAQRARQPITMLKMEIDDYEDLSRHHGEITSQFVVKSVTQRVTSDIRATDYMARLSGSTLAVLLPGTGEIMGLEIAERMREDVQDFPIDDGRGAVLQVTISVGLVTWEPEHYPAVDMPKLTKQIQSSADKGLLSSQSNNGNQVSVSRLSTLMI